MIFMTNVVLVRTEDMLLPNVDNKALEQAVMKQSRNTPQRSPDGSRLSGEDTIQTMANMRIDIHCHS